MAKKTTKKTTKKTIENKGLRAKVISVEIHSAKKHKAEANLI